MMAFQKSKIIFLSVCLLFCTVGSLFSAQATELSTTAPEGNMVISVRVTAASKPEFSVSIPSGIQLGDLQRTANSVPKRQEFEVSVQDIQYLNGKTVTVTLSADSGEFYLYAEEHKLPFKVYLGDADDQVADTVKNGGDVFAAFTADGSAVGYVEVDQKDIRKDGTYRGSFIFTVTSD